MTRIFQIHLGNGNGKGKMTMNQGDGVKKEDRKDEREGNNVL